MERLTKQQIDELVTLSFASLDEPWLDQLVVTHRDHIVQRMNYYRFFYHFVRVHQPQVCLELGVEFGLGSAHMVTSASRYGGIVIGIDHSRHEVPAIILPKRYPKNYFFINGDTRASVRTLLAILHHKGLRTPVRGFVFQDSSHHYKASVGEWELYSRYLASGSVWMCDDITPSFHDPHVDPPGKGMTQYFEELPGEKYLYPDILHKGNTIGVVLL